MLVISQKLINYDNVIAQHCDNVYTITNNEIVNIFNIIKITVDKIIFFSGNTYLRSNKLNCNITKLIYKLY